MLIEALVRRKEYETEEIARFELVRATGEKLPAFTAGAHIDVHIPGGYVRQYSLCNAPSETDRYVIGVLKDPASRGGSLAMHRSVAEGARVQISEPRNLFPLDEGAGRTLLFAGGIGVTPMLAMAERLSALGRSFELRYCGRSRSRLAFLDRIGDSPFKEHVFVHCDDEDAEQQLDIVSLLRTVSADTHLYVCGPNGFMEHVLGYAAERGWPEGQVHREYFGAPLANTEGDEAFEVQIASTGVVVAVPAGSTVVAALEACGIVIPVSCEQGICGTCLTKVIEGVPDHRDMYLTDAEHDANDRFLPCCSRAKTPRLVVDL